MSRAELPTGLSATYWLPWYPSRRGAGIHDSLDPGEDWIGTWDGVGLYERSVCASGPLMGDEGLELSI